MGDGTLGGEKVRKISIGLDVKCAVTESDKIYLWGDSPYFQGITNTPSAITAIDKPNLGHSFFYAADKKAMIFKYYTKDECP